MKSVASTFNYSATETGVSSGENVANFEGSLFENYSRSVEGGNKGERLPEHMDAVAPYNIGSGSSGTTVVDHPFYFPTSSNTTINTESSETQICSGNEHMHQICGDSIQPTSASSHGIVESSINGDLIGNHASAFFVFSNSGSSSSISAVSDSSLTSYSSGYDTCQDIIPSSLDFLMSEREQSPGLGGMLQVGMVGIPSNVHPSSSAEINSRGARRNSRRLFRDAFSSSNADSSNFIFVNDNSDDVWSRERLLEFHDDSLGAGLGRDFRGPESQASASSDQQRHSRSEVMFDIPSK